MREAVTERMNVITQQYLNELLLVLFLIPYDKYKVSIIINIDFFTLNVYFFSDSMFSLSSLSVLFAPFSYFECCLSFIKIQIQFFILLGKFKVIVVFSNNVT